MTYEELKLEAKKQGYKLIKIYKKERLLPCICGRRRRSRWYDSTDYMTMKCDYCGRQVKGRTEFELHKKWNAMIRKELEEQKHE